jgi:hypothetical protein
MGTTPHLEPRKPWNVWTTVAPVHPAVRRMFVQLTRPQAMLQEQWTAIPTSLQLGASVPPRAAWLTSV